MGVLSIAWYVGLTLISENILFDGLLTLGLLIAFYYGLTAIACVVYFRKLLFKSVKNFLFIGLAPLIGAAILAWAFVKSIIDLSNPANSESGESWFGLGPPLVIAIGFLILGVILMLIQFAHMPAFFKRKIQTAAPDALDAPAPEGAAS